MCKHENEIIIGTNGKYFKKMCTDCGKTRTELKKQLVKKTWLQKLLKK